MVGPDEPVVLAFDGSWTNDSDRWLEGNAPLATTYALLALEETLKPVTPGE